MFIILCPQLDDLNNVHKMALQVGTGLPEGERGIEHGSVPFQYQAQNIASYA